MPKGGEACGKNPLGRAHHDKMSPEATAMVIEREPEKFQAVGVFTGPRSEGLVILDVDANLGAVLRRRTCFGRNYGDDDGNGPDHRLSDFAGHQDRSV